MAANIELHRRERVSPFRKIALGAWRTAYDPSIYGTMKVRMEPVLRFIEAFREETGKKLTVTHVIAKTIAIALKECPEANAILRWSGLYRRRRVDVSILVLMEDEGRKDLSSATIRDLDKKPLVELCDELQARAEKIRSKQDQELESTRQTMSLMPAFLMYPLLNLLSFLMYTLNLDLRWLGLPKDAFGGAVVTSIGSIGLQTGYVPLVPYTRVPIFVAPGEIGDEPVVDDGEVGVGKVLHLNVTFDHRIIDGSHAAQLAATVRRVLSNPAGELR